MLERRLLSFWSHAQRKLSKWCQWISSSSMPFSQLNKYHPHKSVTLCAFTMCSIKCYGLICARLMLTGQTSSFGVWVLDGGDYGATTLLRKGKHVFIFRAVHSFVLSTCIFNYVMSTRSIFHS